MALPEKAFTIAARSSNNPKKVGLKSYGDGSCNVRSALRSDWW